MKIILAGAESDASIQIVKKIKPPAVLMTHYYLRDKSAEKVERLLKSVKDLGIWLVIDSGAFSFFSKYAVLQEGRNMEEFKKTYHLNEGEIKPEDEWKLNAVEARNRFEAEFSGYFEKWMERCDIYYKYADMIAEIDVDALVGMERMWEMRKRYHKYHDKICYTPHLGIAAYGSQATPETEANIQKLFDLNPVYFGIGRMDFKKITDIWNRYLPTFKEKKIRVHGWAQTSWESIQHYPFFSVDSSTWLKGTQYGCTYEYKEGWSAIRTYDYTKKEIRKSFQKECEDNLIDHEALCNDISSAVDEWSCLQWKKFSQYWESNLNEAYWLEDEERDALIDNKRDSLGMNNLVVRTPTSVNIVTDNRVSQTRLCNSCVINDKCTMFKKNNTCAFSFSGLTEGLTSAEIMRQLIDTQVARVSQAVMAERVMGGHPDANVSKEISQLTRMIKDYHEMTVDKPASVTLTAQGKGSGGILSSLFSNLSQPSSNKVEKAEIIDV